MHKAFMDYLSNLKNLHHSRKRLLNVLRKDHDNYRLGEEEFGSRLETADTKMEEIIKFFDQEVVDYFHKQLAVYDIDMERFEQWRSTCFEAESLREKLNVLERRQNCDKTTIKKYKEDELSVSQIKSRLANALQREVSCHLNSWMHNVSKWIRDYFNEEVSFYNKQNSLFTEWDKEKNRLYSKASPVKFFRPIGIVEEFDKGRRAQRAVWASPVASTSKITYGIETETSNIFPDALIHNEEASTAPKSLNVDDEIFEGLNADDKAPSVSDAVNSKDEVPAVSDASDKDVHVNLEGETNVYNIGSKSASRKLPFPQVQVKRFKFSPHILRLDLPDPYKRPKEETMREEEKEFLPVLYQVRAFRTYITKNKGELSFNKFDIIDIIDDSDKRNVRSLTYDF
ncbi:hypothetical protein TNCT_662411 [Trichonephila clavata]|uniref:Uncharacterized protein n=1 Tax=Trichonephila clavata TaxID=2740835 RepID=A0A8X6GSL5_TRICU|nr:hypothetical protein TNCT_662411 [Trichonephila clavata]